jgi:hypothetical protein
MLTAAGSDALAMHAPAATIGQDSLRKKVARRGTALY